MSDRDRDQFARWRERYEALEERDAEFTTVSGREIEPVYTPLDTGHLDHTRHLGLPGQFPYTRGIHGTMYRGRLWTMRQYAGFGAA
ncbi:MAG: methylmalonyl-CoA mutase family protein, partial [Gemmatimonadales bacterium]